jgi:hypothetical protein
MLSSGDKDAKSNFDQLTAWMVKDSKPKSVKSDPLTALLSSFPPPVTSEAGGWSNLMTSPESGVSEDFVKLTLPANGPHGVVSPMLLVMLASSGFVKAQMVRSAKSF